MMTLSEIHKYAESLDVEGMVSEKSLLPAGAKASPDEIMGKVCGIYQKVRPFLEVITSLFFIPKKWRTAILSFMAVLDGLCPGSANPDL